MIEAHDVDGGVGVLEETCGLDPAELLESSVVAALRARFAGYRSAESRAMVRVWVAAAYANALRVPYWLSFSQRDYANAVLGVKPSTFRRWIKLGRLLCRSAGLREQVVAGRVNSTQLELLCSEKSATTRDGAADESHAEASGSQDFTRLAITAPVPAILYIEESMELARAFVGRSGGDEEALAALLAEASTELRSRVDLAVARRRFRVRDGKRRRADPRAGRGSEGIDSIPGSLDRTRLAATLPHVAASNTSAAVSFARPLAAAWDQPASHPLQDLSVAAMGEVAQRRTALRVHEILLRLIRRRDRLAVRQEDQLFEWSRDLVHERNGFRNFERFAREILDLPASSCNARLKQARLRRREHPVALARGQGRITAVQAELLEQLQRTCFVPPSDLERWIVYATQHTVRRLRKAITWAHGQMTVDYRRWSLSRCETPSEDQLQTSARSLERLVRDPAGDARGDALDEALIRWQLAPKGTARFHIRRETRDELLVAMASMQDEVRGHGEFVAPGLIPGWLALCRIFERARRTWMQHYQAPPAAQRRILDRDGYLCATPECTQRRNLHVHHVGYRSQGGGDEDSNRVTLCAFHHIQGEHGGLMRVRGRIDEHGRGLTWEMGRDENGRARRVYRDERVLVRSERRGL